MSQYLQGTTAFIRIVRMLLVCFINMSTYAAAITTSLDAGGNRSTNAHYAMDGSFGSFSGISSSQSSIVISRSGYVGQLYDVQEIRLNALSPAFNEGITNQLLATAIMDDATVLPLPNGDVIWSVINGPVASISANGLALATNVYQDSPATVEAHYQSKVSRLTLSILNAGTDDFGLYASDGVDDSWQVRYFGLSNTNALSLSDPDGDGASNFQEYLADTDPTNALSFFQIQSISKNDGYRIYFRSSSNRKYTLYCSTNLLDGKWTPVTSLTAIRGNDNVIYFSDYSPDSNPCFYRIRVSLP